MTWAFAAESASHACLWHPSRTRPCLPHPRKDAAGCTAAATVTLNLKVQGERPSSSGNTAASAASNAAQLIPISVKSADHSTRELAFAAQRYAKAAQKDPSDYESVYNHGLALQELASRMAASRTEQMQLLEKVRSPLFYSNLSRCSASWMWAAQMGSGQCTKNVGSAQSLRLVKPL